MKTIIITGDRRYTYTDYVHGVLDRTLKSITNRGEGLKVLTGHNQGIDDIIRSYCKSRGIPCVPYKPMWEKFGKNAGPIRNLTMAKKSDAAVLFGDVSNIDVKSMHAECEKRSVDIHNIQLEMTGVK